MEACLRDEAFDLTLRLGPFVVLLFMTLWLTVSTWILSARRCQRRFHFGRTRRSRLTGLLFTVSVVGALAATLTHAVHVGGFVLEPLAIAPLIFVPIGMLVMVAAAVFVMMARADMGRNWQVGIADERPDELVTTGLFAMSRNPVFLGMVVLALGLVLALPSPAVIVCAGLFTLACNLQIRDEEAFLRGMFGRRFHDYEDGVGRWL